MSPELPELPELPEPQGAQLLVRSATDELVAAIERLARALEQVFLEMRAAAHRGPMG